MMKKAVLFFACAVMMGGLSGCGLSEGEKAVDKKAEATVTPGEVTPTQAAGEAEGINDPYDLSSWDGGIQSDIPYQEAGGEGLPIGRGNSWYYFDESSGEYLPW